MKIFQTLIQNATFRVRTAPLIISLTLLFSTLIIAATPPATGYELSIYEAYPHFLWVLLTINIFFSIYTIIQSCDGQSKGLYGYFSIFVIYTILFFLPIIRGYYSISRGPEDVYYHMFMASQIVHSGYLPLEDFYPMMHVWLSIMYNFIPHMNILTIIFTIIFIVLYVFSLYILGQNVLGKKNGGILVSLFGIPLIFYVNYDFYPFLFALLIIPLILYTYQNITQNPKQKSSFYICLIVLSLFIVFCHPMISFFLIIMFSLFTCYELIKKWASAGRQNIEAANIVIIVSLTLSLWWLRFRYVTDSLQKIAYAFLGDELHVSIIAYQTNAIKTSNASIFLVIDRFIKIYGSIFLYCSISLIFLSYIIYQYFRNRRIYETDFIYSIQFCIGICMGIALLTGYFVIFEPIRAVMYGLLFATIICGFFFYRIWFSGSEKRRWGLIPLLIIIITVVCMLTMVNIYSSPWIGGVNTALTYGDKNGNDWILKYQNPDIPIVKEELSNYKYSWYYFESVNAKSSQQIEYTHIIPSHFGYSTNSTMGDSLSYLSDKSLYMLTTEMMKISPFAIPPERRNLVKSFTDSDFIRLKNDPTVNLVYSGYKFGVWNIERQ